MEVQVSAVTANAPVEILPTPDKAKAPPMSQATIESEKIGDGIWYIGGIRHGSVAVEFRDFVAVVEAPLNEKRAIAVINQVYRLIPNKPIRYLVNSHHHFDHSGGIRTFVAEGAKVVTHQNDRDFYERVVLSPAPRTLEPDRLSLLNPPSYRESAIEPVPFNDKYTRQRRNPDPRRLSGAIHDARDDDGARVPATRTDGHIRGRESSRRHAAGSGRRYKRLPAQQRRQAVDQLADDGEKALCCGDRCVHADPADR